MSEQAGREMDARVAEKVMGWESVTDELEIAKREGVPECVDSQRWHRKQVWFNGNEKMACEECGTLPDYSTSIAAAWEVVEKFEAMQLFRYTTGRYIACLADGNSLHEGEADTAPLAICKAALKAVGA